MDIPSIHTENIRCNILLRSERLKCVWSTKDDFKLKENTQEIIRLSRWYGSSEYFIRYMKKYRKIKRNISFFHTRLSVIFLTEQNAKSYRSETSLQITKVFYIFCYC